MSLAEEIFWEFGYFLVLLGLPALIMGIGALGCVLQRVKKRLWK